jgi:hypothetical protein
MMPTIQQIDDAILTLTRVKGMLLAERKTTKNIAGWNVTPYRGYFRAFKRIGGKLHSLYLGKTLDDAESKIKTKQSALSVQSQHN